MASSDGRSEWAWRSPLVLALAGLGLFLIAIEFARPCFFLHDDNATWFLGAYVHDFRVLTETGRVAEVNFFQYGGEPFLQQGQTAVLYPPVYVAVALAKSICGDARWTIEWLAAGHLFAALLGFYFWLRCGGVKSPLAALGGLAWALNPFVLLIGASWVTVIYLACYLPWLFWAFDRLLLRPSHRSAFFLGAILALFLLQGYVQWVGYAIFFLSLYALFRLFEKSNRPRLSILYYLEIAALIFLIFTSPLLVPMFHATELSAARAQPLSMAQALSYRVTLADLLRAQIGLYRHGWIFGVSTAILFSPALLFLPATLVHFFRADSALRQKLFPLLVLAFLALLFSTRWHVFLSLLPLFDKFRWPFKVFVYADFFLLAGMIGSMTTWKRASSAVACLAAMIFAGAAVVISGHDENTFSRTTLTHSVNTLPPAVDRRLGRVVALDTILPEASSARFFTHAFGTYFAVPSLGGYNPLVAPEQLRFALGIDFPNVFKNALTPAVRNELDERAVRYWIVDPNSPQLAQVEALGLRPLLRETDRILFEDMQARPLVYFWNGPHQPGSLTFAGNSLLIPVRGFKSPAYISLGPTDGWWYRIDGGPWQPSPSYLGNRLIISFPTDARLLEVSYFDARFREGLRLSAELLLILALLLVAGHLLRKRITLNSF
jgi:hypothetical protein